MNCKKIYRTFKNQTFNEIHIIKAQNKIIYTIIIVLVEYFVIAQAKNFLKCEISFFQYLLTAINKKQTSLLLLWQFSSPNLNCETCAGQLIKYTHTKQIKNKIKS